MINREVLFIVNPISGKAKIKNDFLAIIDLFVKEGYLVTVYTTQKSGDGREMATLKGNDYSIIVCCGGDGTLNEVVSGLISINSSCKIGYIPAGTTNDFASSMGISKHSETAARAVLNGMEFPCDIGVFNQRHFLYVAAFGIFTNVSYSTSQEYKNTMGQMAYILEGAKSLTDIKSYYLEVVTAEETIQGEFIFGMVSNSNRIGGIKNLAASKIELNDGLFEVLLVRKPNNILELSDIIISLLNQEHHSEYIYKFSTSSLEVVSTTPISWTLDGENGGELTSAKIDNLNEAVTFLV